MPDSHIEAIAGDVCRRAAIPSRAAMLSSRPKGQYTVVDERTILKSYRLWVNTRPSGNKPAAHCWDKVVSVRR